VVDVATSILIPIWLVALLSTLKVADLRREFSSAAGGLPLLLVLFAALGMLWAQIPFTERIAASADFSSCS